MKESQSTHSIDDETEEAGEPGAEAGDSPAGERSSTHGDPDAVTDAPPEMVTFDSFGLSEPVMKAIGKMGFVEPTPIQKKALPLVLEGKDLLGQAQTGTGKTAAFGIPMAERLDKDGPVAALVLCPTRELAVQVAEEVHEITLFSEHKVLPVYGGQRIDRQINALKKGVQIVAGTPGRILDHLGRGTLKLDGLRMLVLDEADMMLDMGFIPDIRRIIRQCPEDRQTLLFSATIPDEIHRISERYMRDPESVSVVPETLTLDDTEQIFYEVPEEEKLEALMRILDYEDEGESAMIFCRTRRNVDKLARKLKSRGYDVDGLHGDLTQAQRDRIMQGFRDGKFSYLVATDVASRGLDISHVSHVINYHIPQDPEAYVHRIGRTGRMGRSGVAITLVTPAEYWDLLRIQEFSQAQIAEGTLPEGAEMPSTDEVEERRRAAKGDEEAQERVRKADRGVRVRREEAMEAAAGAEETVTEQAAEEQAAEKPATKPPRRTRRRRRPEKPVTADTGSSFFAELLDMTEGATTEAERHQRRHTLRDIEKRIEVTDVDEVLKESARLESEERIQRAHRDALEERGEPRTEREALERDARRSREAAEGERRRDVRERLDAAKAALESGAPAPRLPEPVVEKPSMDTLIEAAEEERIRRALRLRDAVAGMVREARAEDLVDFRAVTERVASDHDPLDIAAVLLRELVVRGIAIEGHISAAKPSEDEDEMTRLFVSIGRRARINRDQLEELVRESAELTEADIGRVDLLHNFAFIEVRKAVAGRVIERMHESVFRGREISVEPAKSKPPED